MRACDRGGHEVGPGEFDGARFLLERAGELRRKLLLREFEITCDGAWEAVISVRSGLIISLPLQNMRTVQLAACIGKERVPLVFHVVERNDDNLPLAFRREVLLENGDIIELSVDDFANPDARQLDIRILETGLVWRMGHSFAPHRVGYLAAAATMALLSLLSLWLFFQQVSPQGNSILSPFQIVLQLGEQERNVTTVVDAEVPADASHLMIAAVIPAGQAEHSCYSLRIEDHLTEEAEVYTPLSLSRWEELILVVPRDGRGHVEYDIEVLGPCGPQETTLQTFLLRLEAEER